MAVRRGEIYWVEFEPVKGSEQGGLRPALGENAVRPIGQLAAARLAEVDAALEFNLGLH
jgi:mRNA-degrading endonuclease toxin of MazEF toxin-antitoxin module